MSTFSEARDAYETRIAELERDLASVNDANLLLHKRMEELTAERNESDAELLDVHNRAEAAEAQLAERDKRIEALREALELLAAMDWEDDIDVRRIARAALADPVVVPGWDDGTWNQEC